MSAQGILDQVQCGRIELSLITKLPLDGEHLATRPHLK